MAAPTIETSDPIEPLNTQPPAQSSFDTHLTLKTFTLRTPEKPMAINGRDFGLQASPWLVDIVNKANGHYSDTENVVEGVEVVFGSNLPTLLNQDTKRPNVRHTTLFNPESRMVSCIMPREVTDHDFPESQIIARCEAELSRQIQIGLLQSMATREAFKWHYIRVRAAIGAGAMVGSVIGVKLHIDSNDSWAAVPAPAILGTISGAGVPSIGLFFNEIFNSVTFKDLEPRIRRKAQRMLKPGSYRGELTERLKTARALELVPIVEAGIVIDELVRSDATEAEVSMVGIEESVDK